MNISKEQKEAVNDIVELIVEKLSGANREIVVVDAISTCARLAGSLLFRSFNFQIENPQAGTVMLSENANIKGPELVNLTHSVLQNYGIIIDNQKMNSGSLEQTDIDFIDAINLVQNEAIEILNKYKLTYEQLAHSCAFATAFIIQQSPSISSELGFGKAIYHYIEGSKTYPPDLAKTQLINEVNSKTNAENETTEIKAKDDIKIENETTEIRVKEDIKKPWWKVW